MLHKLPNMTRRNIVVAVLSITLGACATGGGAPPSSVEQDQLVSEAQKTLSDFLRDPDQTWIQNNLGRSKAVLISPKIVRAGFIFGGSGGRAVLMARDGRNWAGPAFYDLATASVGLSRTRLSSGIAGDARRPAALLTIAV